MPRKIEKLENEKTYPRRQDQHKITWSQKLDGKKGSQKVQAKREKLGRLIRKDATNEREEQAQKPIGNKEGMEKGPAKKEQCHVQPSIDREHRQPKGADTNMMHQERKRKGTTWAQTTRQIKTGKTKTHEPELKPPIGAGRSKSSWGQ